MMFLYGLNCVALFVGYCVLFFLAVLLLALIVSYAAKRGRNRTAVTTITRHKPKGAGG